MAGARGEGYAGTPIGPAPISKCGAVFRPIAINPALKGEARPVVKALLDSYRQRLGERIPYSIALCARGGRPAQTVGGGHRLL